MVGKSREGVTLYLHLGSGEKMNAGWCSIHFLFLVKSGNLHQVWEYAVWWVFAVQFT